MTEPLSLFWFRNDLRLEDNTGLYQALRSGLPVLPVYIFSTDELEDPGPGTCRRLSFVYDRLLALQDRLVALGSSLMVLKGSR